MQNIGYDDEEYLKKKSLLWLRFVQGINRYLQNGCNLGIEMSDYEFNEYPYSY